MGVRERSMKEPLCFSTVSILRSYVEVRIMLPEWDRFSSSTIIRLFKQHSCPLIKQSVNRKVCEGRGFRGFRIVKE